VVDAEPLWVSIARVKPADPDVVPAPFRSTSRPWAPPLSSLPLCWFTLKGGWMAAHHRTRRREPWDVRQRLRCVAERPRRAGGTRGACGGGEPLHLV